MFVKTTVKRSVQCHIFDQLLPGQHTFDKYLVNTLHCTVLCKNVSLHYYLAAMVINMQSLCARARAHTHTFSTIWRHWSGKHKKRKLGYQWMRLAKEILLHAILGTRAIGLPAPP